MISKYMSTGARLFCYKYVLSVYLLCLSHPFPRKAGKGGGGRTGHVLSQGETRLHRMTKCSWPSSLCPSLCAGPDARQAWCGYW